MDSLYAKCETFFCNSRRAELRCAWRPAVRKRWRWQGRAQTANCRPCPRHPLHLRLRHRRAREARTKVPPRAPVRPFPSRSCNLRDLTPPPLSNSVARDPRFERLPCSHKGTYADDCIVERVNSHRCYIVATCDRALRRRLRKVPGVPVRGLLSIEQPVSRTHSIRWLPQLMYISKKRYAIERLPDQALG